jgi:AcrR family transcriptional regulator
MTEAPTKSYHHGNLRNELLDTAEAQLAEGVDELSLRALARSVGVSQTAPYRHFSDKNELLVALATRGYEQLLSELKEAGKTAGGPEGQLAAFAHTYVNYAVDHPDLFRLMFGPMEKPQQDYPDLRQAMRDTYDLVRSIMREGMAQGIFKQEDTEYLANAGWSGIHGLATLKIDSPQLFERHIDLRRQIELGVQIFLAGLRTGD